MTEPLHTEHIPLSGRHLIEASAGTGKTYQITQLYLRLLLEQGLKVQQILVMTFTRAATQELRGRIAERISQLQVHWDAEALDDQHPVLRERCDPTEARSRLREALLMIDEAAIYTIHGFCKRVLSQRAFDSGLPFNLEMEADTGGIELDAVRDWYRILAERETDYLKLIVSWPGPEDFHGFIKPLLSAGVTPDYMRPDQLLDQFISNKRSARALIEGEADYIAACLIDSHKQSAQRRGEWDLLLGWLADESTAAIPADAKAFYHGGRFGKDHKARLNAIFNPLKQLVQQAASMDQRMLSAETYGIALDGLHWIRQRVERAKADQRLLNFDDLVRVLASRLSGETGERLAARLRAEFPAALVDEFQDTDQDQYKILNRLYPAGGEQALFMIGDPKQSIYAFRGGDVFAYLQAREQADHQWWLDTNWRSTPGINEAVNRLFARDDVFSYGIQYLPVVSAERFAAFELVDPQPRAALNLVHFPLDDAHRYNNKPVMKQSFLSSIAAWCANEIQRLLSAPLKIDGQDLTQGDIAVLVRDRHEAGIMQDALAQRDCHAVYMSRHDDLFKSAEAAELLRFMRGISDTTDQRLLLSALATRYMGVDAASLAEMQRDESVWERESRKLFELRERWQQHGFMAMAIWMLQHYCRPESEQHDRFMTNAIHLFECMQQASQHQRSPYQLTQWLRERIDSDLSAEAELRLENDANLIRIQTLHGAKGLEYPIVFIPFASRYRDPGKLRKNECIAYHDPSTWDKKLYLGEQPALLKLARDEGHAESIRLLYVAITRAKYRCYLCSAPLDGYENSPLGLTLGIEPKDDIEPYFKSLAGSDGAAIGFIDASETIATAESFSADSFAKDDVSPAVFRGQIHQSGRLSSFSSLTAYKESVVHSAADRDQQNRLQQPEQMSAPNQLLPLRFAMPKGAQTGTLMHEMLERADFKATDLTFLIESQLRGFPAFPAAYSAMDMNHWLLDCLATPLLDDLTLNAIPMEDTLRETGFYFPVQSLNMNALEIYLSRYRGGSMHAELPARGVLMGMMHGYIDLIFQWRGRYYVADYKTNYLGDDIQAYDSALLEVDVRHHDYDLQYLLYSLALHRYLRDRKPDYDPAVDLGGVFYLYLRGMSAAGKTGVYHRSIQPGELAEFERLFDA